MDYYRNQSMASILCFVRYMEGDTLANGVHPMYPDMFAISKKFGCDKSRSYDRLYLSHRRYFIGSKRTA